MNNNQEPTADVIVIGSGPAGMAASIALKRAGLNVTVLERGSKLGGIPRHCGHPPFGMREYGKVLTGPQYAEENINVAIKLGVDIRKNHTVLELREGGELLVSSSLGISTFRAKRVLIATGARETPRSARLVGGDRVFGIMNTGALQSYLYEEKEIPFKRPLIVGTELVGLSAIWSCIKAGIKPVAIIEPGKKVIARWPLGMFPKLVGVSLKKETKLIKINGGEKVKSATVFHSGTYENIECDGVILTGDFLPESTIIRSSHLDFDVKSGGPVINQFGQCSDKSYYAAGNLLRPIETAGWSYREGKSIAKEIVYDLKGFHETSHEVESVILSDEIKYSIPQVIFLNKDGGLRYLQMRVSKAISGYLVLSQSGRVVYRKYIKALPERRILVPLSKIKIDNCKSVLEIKLETLKGVDLDG